MPTLEELLANQNVPDQPPVQVQQQPTIDRQYQGAPQAPAPQPSAYEQALANPAPQAQPMSRLGSFLVGLTNGANAPQAINAINSQKAQARQAQLDTAKQIDEVAADKASLPMLKAYYKKLMPDLDVEGLQPGQLQNFAKKISDVIKMHSDLQDSATKASAEKANEAYRQGELDFKKLMLEEKAREANLKANEDKTKKSGDAISAAQKEYLNMKPVQESQKGLDAANEVADLIEQAKVNPAMAAGLPVAMARMSTHGQRINQVEIGAFGGSKALMAKLQRYSDMASKGTLRPEDYVDMANIAKVYAKANERALESASQEHVNRMMQRPAFKGQSKAEVYKALTGKDMGVTTSSGFVLPGGK